MISSNYSTMNDTPLRKIEGKVVLSNDSTAYTRTFLATDRLQEITVARVGEKGKFFGYGICQQATVKIVDTAGDIVFLKGNKLQLSFRASADENASYDSICPPFYVKDAVRDEKSNVITVTAYDALDASVSHVFSELGMTAPYTIRDVVSRITTFLGLYGVSYPSAGFDTVYEKGANLSSTTNLRAVLNAIAEVTQTIYYIDQGNHLIFKRLNKSSGPVLTVNKRDYFELNTGLPVTLSKIVSATELGDNFFAGNNTGVTQYVRENPFWNNRTDIATLLQASIDRISGLTIVPFSLKWRGNFLTEIGDKIKIEIKTKEAGSKYIETFILDDSFTYNGGLNQSSDWEYNPDSDRTTAANPITIGEKINQTFARVDKIEKNITLYVSDIVDEVLPEKIVEATDSLTQEVEKLKATTENHTENISQLQLTSTSINSEVSSLKETTTTLRNDLGEVQATQSNIQSDVAALQLTSNQISASVSSVEQKVTDLGSEIDGVSDQANARIDTLSSDVALKLDKTGVEITIEQKLESGVDKVVTASKNYTFDDTGLNISSGDSEISTRILEDGMRIYKNEQEVLVANNRGVTATDLYATTFLIIGENSRLENSGRRTACFWIGPSEE